MLNLIKKFHEDSGEDNSFEEFIFEQFDIDETNIDKIKKADVYFKNESVLEDIFLTAFRGCNFRRGQYEIQHYDTVTTAIAAVTNDMCLKQGLTQKESYLFLWCMTIKLGGVYDRMCYPHMTIPEIEWYMNEQEIGGTVDEFLEQEVLPICEIITIMRSFGPFNAQNLERFMDYIQQGVEVEECSLMNFFKVEMLFKYLYLGLMYMEG